MTIETIDIGAVLPDPANVRRHSAQQIDMLKASLSRFGQQLPLLLRPDGTLLAGHARLEAMKSLGWTTVQVIRSDLTGVRATEYAIADNALHDRSEFDGEALSQLVASLSGEDGFDSAALGFSPEDLTKLLGGFEPEEVTAPDAFPAFGEDIATEHECPRCHFKWSGSTAPKGAS